MAVMASDTGNAWTTLSIHKCLIIWPRVANGHTCTASRGARTDSHTQSVHDVVRFGFSALGPNESLRYAASLRICTVSR